ncbi:sensor histidine kinase [Denitromonas iodatirespirans]|uniref:histidine kinase n=1 Tax=Denitromonas iodatirespirans TaxID=2795389 RepID=A0A944DF76_DENI1|nr:sensor histidine kinase [Denitromonas iodatirespirans]MBT0963981.1 histidine kinase [Denitromonas iodatirespirans]
MLSSGLIVGVSFAYLVVLFGVALYGDRRADAGRSLIANPWVYALSMAVYCTAWTYYGSVGRAATAGLGFLPVYLGPTLVMGVSWLVLLKMVRISKAYRITSIADFIASRYGKSRLLASMVTLVAVIGIVPYIALQLKAVSSEYGLLTGGHPGTSGDWYRDTALYMALVLAAFTMIFGTRHLDATERHEGMVAAIAFESLVKLVAFMAVGIVVTYYIFDGWEDLFVRAAIAPDLAPLLSLDAVGNKADWLALTVLSALAFLMLPRQFQVSVVENVDERHLKRATWLFPAYLLLINIFVLPIALGGMLHFPADVIDPDSFVLTLPLAEGYSMLTLAAFIGGLSAATSMVIVETIALSTMVCNDLVMPLLLSNPRFRRWAPHDLTGLLLLIRRGAIVAILLLGYLYFRLAGQAYALVSIGLISFAAVVQFAPALLGGMYWRGATRNGAVAGLLAGFCVWLYTLLLPSFAKSGWLPADFVDSGIFGIALLMPERLFGFDGVNATTHALFWSMLANIGAFVAVSLWRPPTAVEAGQASLFVDILKREPRGAARLWRGQAKLDDLRALLVRFLGAERVRAGFASYALSRGEDDIEALEADADLVHFAETLLAGAIGSVSARVMIASVVQEESLGIEEVMNILDEASQVRAYSRELEEKSQALQAATEDLRAANERLQELDRVKDDFMSSVTHELRTPLTSIRAFSEMLLDDPKTDLAERRRFLGIIVEETERLTRLVNQVLDLAKIESGHAQWHETDVDLIELIEHVATTAGQLVKSRHAELVLDLPPTVTLLRVDQDRLIQVLTNLIGNAARFVPGSGGQVKVVLRESGDSVRVDVCDNGPGIAPEAQSEIFEKFRQVSGSAGKPTGTGLGLPISRQIIEHFGGRLWVTSIPGEGAVFSFELPLKLAAPTADSDRAA